MKKLLYISILIVSFFSCKTPESYNHTGKTSKIKFELSNYEIYQFSMSRKKDTIGQKIKSVKFYETPVGYNDGIVHEILYLFRDTKSDQVLYFTTFSHKYLFFEEGRLNAPYYKEYVDIDDIDHIYVGKEIENKFAFYNPYGRAYSQNIQFFFSEIQIGIISIDSVTNDYAKLKDRIAKPYVKIEEEVFGIPINFRKQEKEIAFVCKDENDNPTGEFLRTVYLKLDDRKLSFESVNKVGDTIVHYYGNKKLRYIEPQ